jgi:hypothetical protein
MPGVGRIRITVCSTVSALMIAHPAHAEEHHDGTEQNEVVTIDH